MSEHCKHKVIIESRDFCPHNGYSTDYNCEECGTPFNMERDGLHYFTGEKSKLVGYTIEEVL